MTTPWIKLSLVLSLFRIGEMFAHPRLEPADPARAVTGVDSPTRHKLEVNVVEASRTDNQVVVADKANLMQKTITETLREKLGLRPPPFKPAYSHGYHRIFSI